MAISLIRISLLHSHICAEGTSQFRSCRFVLIFLKILEDCCSLLCCHDNYLVNFFSEFFKKSLSDKARKWSKRRIKWRNTPFNFDFQGIFLKHTHTHTHNTHTHTHTHTHTQHGNYTRILRAILNKSWRNTPQGTNYTATCLSSRKLSKLDEPDMQDTAGEAGTSS